MEFYKTIIDSSKNYVRQLKADNVKKEDILNSLETIEKGVNTIPDEQDKIKTMRRKVKIQRKALPSKEDENTKEQIIYLVPELVFATGIDTSNDSTDRRRNIISKTKIDPNKKRRNWKNT